MTQTEIRKDLILEIKAAFEVDQKGVKQTLVVRKDRVVIGSVLSADIKLTGSRIAPIHAFVELTFSNRENNCQARIIDLASPTGILVNGKKTVNQLLNSGDLIQIGDSIIRFNFFTPRSEDLLSEKVLLLIDENDVKPIFDYRPSIKEALEVVCAWNGVILNVKHFMGQSEVKLGDRRDDDFLVPLVLSNPNHRLAQKLGNQWTLFLDRKMSGLLYLNGDLVPIESTARHSVVLGPNDFAKIEIGTLSFYISQTVAPPELKNQTTLIADPFLGRTLLLSLAVMGTMLFGVSKMDVTQVDQTPVPETIATILYHPEKYSVVKPIEESKPKEPKPEEKIPEAKKATEVDFTQAKKPESKKAQKKSSEPGKHHAAESQAKGGAGARAKGAEGSRGAKNAKPSSQNQNAANRPSPQNGKDLGGAISQSADNGNVQMLKGETNKILDLLGASGKKLGKSGSKLQGFGGFSTQGNGGLALQGKGKGGGGTADTLLGGTSDHGRGGGKVGTGLGSEGTGAGIVGGKTRVELNVGGGQETVVVGSIDRDAVEAAIRAHRDEFRYCYERELNAGHPTLAGKVVTAFVIGGSGRASQLAIASSSIGSPTVERCVISVLGRIQFPQPAGGVPVTIKYPFAYNGGSK